MTEMNLCEECASRHKARLAGVLWDGSLGLCMICNRSDAEDVFKVVKPVPRIRILGDSIGDVDGNHFIVRYDENNKPSHFEINGEVVSEAEYRATRAPSFP